MRVPGLLLSRQDLENGCIKCPPVAPCSCNTETEECNLVNRDCSNCARIECIPKVGAGGGSKGVSKGALAGGIVGALLLVALAIGAYLWYRRTAARAKAAASAQDVKDIPAPAETVLNRPDPIEKPPMTPYSDPRTPQTGYQTVDQGERTENSPSLGPHYLFSRNPFDDNNSIQTAGSEGTNVIPIALVAPDSHRTSVKSEESAGSSGPVRPPRSPDLDININHNAQDSLRPGHGYPPSTISGISSINNRHSYMSNMTSASEMLNEAPVIMTPMKGSVLGVVKAEVVRAGSLRSTSSNDTLRVPSNRTVATSPLAATSFGPNDVLPEVDENQETNPFDDKHSSTNANFSMSPPPTASTFRASNLPVPNANLTWVQGSQDDGASRPVSMATQAGSVIDIGSATRVNVGLSSPGAASARAHRTTMGRLVSPQGSGASQGTFEEQQAWALAHAQAQAQAQGLDKPRPVSGSSAISATADSILESFPFVPPSPISNRPIRSPPVSPLAQQTFGSGASSPLAQHTFVVAPPSPRTGDSFSQSMTAGSVNPDNDRLPAPPNRRTLGLSTGSQLSTASSGLGSFPFQIDNGADMSDAPPPAYQGRQRASLDTLALTSDLSSYPLGFDRDSGPVQKGGRR